MAMCLRCGNWLPVVFTRRITTVTFTVKTGWHDEAGVLLQLTAGTRTRHIFRLGPANGRRALSPSWLTCVAR
ncbi:Uncharacterised protein [Serratia fonticola]|uniref:Uncharacterized protein n=1 Tax=Serratia fonticola TaxID=47917 RepID=A0A4U9W958_SERFO|nr:Uncharacterised protein [Serratia fonticola]